MNLSVDPSQMMIDPDSVVPLYHQIKQNLREMIENEILKGGELLPSERELGEIYGVNRLTVRQALNDLVSEGALRRQRGVGTFVAEPKLTHALGRVLGFSERIRAEGRKPSSKVLLLESIPSPLGVARRLNIPVDTRLYKLVRLRCADEEPVMLETAYLPADRFPGLDAIDFAHESLYRVLAEEYGCYIVEAEEVLEPVLMTDYEVEILNAEPGTPGMLVEAISYEAQSKPVEFGKSVVRGDKARFIFRIKRQIGQE